MLVVAKLGREANALMEAEGWKWAQVFLDYTWVSSAVLVRDILQEPQGSWLARKRSSPDSLSI
jgi:hypothetical protein